ncbi:MAG: hypothetical protein H6632_11205 [Anaerolineales bacterium]|nr:hypothetical protein [Anaerolineales bacterium]
MSISREIHITGLQIVDAVWASVLRTAGYTEEKIRALAGTKLDHLPLIDTDWAFCEWLAQQIRSGNYGDPWLVTLEYGGAGRRWATMTDKAILCEQVPRLYDLIKY